MEQDMLDCTNADIIAEEANLLSPRRTNVVLGRGGTEIIYEVTDDRMQVVKLAPEIEGDETRAMKHLVDLRFEREVYSRLGYHPRICGYFGPVQRGMRLEKLYQSLRRRLQDVPAQGHPRIQRRLNWALQAAQSIAHLHSQGVVHCDIGCHNFLLDRYNNIKLIDFAGSSLDDSIPGVEYEERGRMPGDYENLASVGAEIFALGSTLFEIIRMEPVYDDVSDEKVRQRFSEGRFPPESEVLFGDIIHRCWRGDYESAEEVAVDVESKMRRAQVHILNN